MMWGEKEGLEVLDLSYVANTLQQPPLEWRRRQQSQVTLSISMRGLLQGLPISVPPSKDPLSILMPNFIEAIKTAAPISMY